MVFFIHLHKMFAQFVPDDGQRTFGGCLRMKQPPAKRHRKYGTSHQKASGCRSKLEGRKPRPLRLFLLCFFNPFIVYFPYLP